MLARNQIRRDSGRVRSPQPQWSNVKFLCSWDGADTDTSADDDSDTGSTITFSDQAQLDTDRRRFGATSLMLDGTGDNCSIPQNSALDIGANDFSLETYVNFGATDEQALMYIYTSASNQRTYGIEYYPPGIDDINELFFYWTTNGVTSQRITAPFRGLKPPIIGDWYHVAVCRNSGVLRLFINGKQIGKTEVLTDTFFNSLLRGMHFGEIEPNIINLDGWMDETRVVIGEGIYTKNFVPPQSRLPRQ